MLTMKHQMDGKEFVQEIGSYVAEWQHGKLTFTAYERDEFGPCLGTWGGHEMPLAQGVESDICAVIYVMNSHGSTIATHRFRCPRDSFVESEGMLPTAVAPPDMQPEPLAA